MQPAQPLAIAVIGCGAHGRGHVFLDAARL